jgi:hypothetical protein
MDSRQKVLLSILGGASCFLVVAFSTVLLWRDRNSELTITSPTASASPNKRDQLEKNEATPANDTLAVAPKESTPELSTPSTPHGIPSLPDEATHKKLVATLKTKIREKTKKLFAGVFQQLVLSENAEDKVIDVLTQPEIRLEQQAFEAAKSGTIPTPPSPEELQAQMSQQDQQLRALLGDAGWAQFNQYRTTVPDRMIIDSMNEEGANLSQSQSEQLLQILTQARQQIIVQSGATSNLSSPDQAVAAMLQQQLLLQQTVKDRSQNILSPEQAAILQNALSRRTVGPKSE